MCVKYELTGFIVQLMVFRNLTCKSNESTSKIILLCLPSVSVAWLLRNPKFHVSSYCFDTLCLFYLAQLSKLCLKIGQFADYIYIFFKIFRRRCEF